MLVLTRRKEEAIVIGDTIEITVLGIRGEQVRLGITAPANVPVHRKEVYDTLVRANRAARPAPTALRSILGLLRGRRGGRRAAPEGPRRDQGQGRAPMRRDRRR